ncbi:MAG: hypothetical protein J6C46_12040 [Clostridia bacterium]|nr:hypothetical protein [Clostridia bacterium]
MYPELMITCDDVQIHVKDGDLLTVAIGNFDKPFNYQEIIDFYSAYEETDNFDDQVYYFSEWSKTSNAFTAYMEPLKRYNFEENQNHILNSFLWALSKENAEKVLFHLGSDFFKA